MEFVWSGLHPFLMREVVEEIVKYLDFVDYVRFRAVNKTAFDSVTPVWIQNKKSDVVKWKLGKDSSSWDKSADLRTFYRRRYHSHLLNFNYPPIHHFAKLIKPIQLHVHLSRNGYDTLDIIYLLTGLLRNVPNYAVGNIYISRNWDDPFYPPYPLLEPYDRVPFNDKQLSFEQVVQEFKNKGIELTHDAGMGSQWGMG